MKCGGGRTMQHWTENGRESNEHPLAENPTRAVTVPTIGKSQDLEISLAARPAFCCGDQYNFDDHYPMEQLDSTCRTTRRGRVSRGEIGESSSQSSFRLPKDHLVEARIMEILVNPWIFIRLLLTLRVLLTNPFFLILHFGS